MNKAIKYRLYPTTEQAILFAKTFGCCRKVYNLMLSDKIESYKSTGKFVSVTPAKYKKDYPYLKEVDSLALANKQLDLQEAFRNTFSKSRKKKNGFPKFKSAKHSRKSYTTNNQHGTVAIIDNKYIKLPKVGKVKAVIHRKPDNNWIIKSATVSQESDGKYFVSVLFEYDNPANTYVADRTKAIGLDYASDGLYVDNNGNVGTNHKYYRESHDKLAKAQRKLSHMQGSKKHEAKSSNYIKQLRKINKIHRHIANQRLDNLHKISTEIANQYDVVCVESLNMKSMSNKGFGNGKATLDNGYGMFLSMLEYKLSDRNKYLVKVDKWFPSSQICHCCGTLHPEMKDLAIRKMICDCGLTISRDQNAAINILHEGLRILNESFEVA
jgi:putative transposase